MSAIGRTEDLRFSPGNRRLALAGYDFTDDLTWDRVRAQWLDVYRGLGAGEVTAAEALRQI